MLLLIHPAYTMVTSLSVSSSVTRRPCIIFVSIPSCSAILEAITPPAMYQHLISFQLMEVIQEALQRIRVVYDVPPDLDDREWCFIVSERFCHVVFLYSV